MASEGESGAVKGGRGGRARALALLLGLVALAGAIRALWPSTPEECLSPAAVRGERARVACVESAAPVAPALPLGTSRVLGLPVDLNALRAEDFASLAGIGPELARAIVEERARRGGFRSVDELAEVNGVGPARMASLRAALERPVP